MNPFRNILFLLPVALLATGKPAFSQDDFNERFLRYFNSKSYAGKVHAIDTLKSGTKIKCYMLVKNELQKIREQAILDNKTEVIDVFLKLDAEIYFYNRNYSKTIAILTDLLARNRIKDYKDSVPVLYHLKNAYVHLHSLNKAINIHKQIMALSRRHNNIDEWYFHPKLSIIYYEMKMYKECLEQQVLEYEDLKHNNQMVLGYFNNRGLFWQKYGNQDSALFCFNKAKDLFHSAHDNKPLSLYDEFTLGLIEGNIGQVFMELKDYKKAIPLLQKDVASSVKSNNILNAAVSQIELARCYLALSQPQLSKKYLDSANMNLSNIEDYNAKSNILKQYAIYYEKTGQYRQSIDYYNRFINFRDSVEQKENLKELISSQVASQIDERENLIRRNQKNILEKNNEVNAQKNIRNFLIIGGVFLILIIIIVTYQLKKTDVQKKLLELKNEQIETRNKIIDKSLIEKDLLIKEVHHRVKNNLQIVSSLLKLQSGKTDSPEIKNSLSEAQDRINSMALLHQLLYRNNDMTSILFNDYLFNLISQISDGFDLENKQISIVPNFIELELDLDTAIPLGLIANELISNAYKHAFENNTGKITIDLVKLFKNTYQLKISDNGKGLPDNFDFSNLHSLGLDIVSILTEQIGAELKAYNSNGANFEIIFKSH